MNLPNFLTLLRIGVVPFFVVFFYIPFFRTWQGSILLSLLFLAASLTDLLDGYLARRRSQVTKFGKFLDPVADKILVISALILLVSEGSVPAWIAVIIISREFIVTGLRMSASLEGVVIAAESLGKYKMFFQSAAMVFLLLVVDPKLYFYKIGLFLLLLSVMFSLFSACQYFVKFGEKFYLLKAK
ncbi:MAG: CDP-diacylglycerol--glycerol-3-phosphate 3-phosphatidyltransferase [Nitrospirae bacterium]|nr:CDP-diacylglycerol--glycerol-3-phosphate 3-phosphatidyltransferase [Candidatus Troglogloeales bacterium]MBI3598837.1 CDP-diacylglycerol--glycerol-3-phosphate 3-phosphatidyltransferase [Candidatus Troglogloeales bacterium]